MVQVLYRTIQVRSRYCIVQFRYGPGVTEEVGLDMLALKAKRVGVYTDSTLVKYEIVQCAVCSMQCVVYSVQISVCSVQWAAVSEHCALITVQECSMQSFVFSLN